MSELCFHYPESLATSTPPLSGEPETHDGVTDSVVCQFEPTGLFSTRRPVMWHTGRGPVDCDVVAWWSHSHRVALSTSHWATERPPRAPTAPAAAANPLLHPNQTQRSTAPRGEQARRCDVQILVIIFLQSLTRSSQQYTLISVYSVMFVGFYLSCCIRYFTLWTQGCHFLLLSQLN